MFPRRRRKINNEMKSENNNKIKIPESIDAELNTVGILHNSKLNDY